MRSVLAAMAAFGLAGLSGLAPAAAQNSFSNQMIAGASADMMVNMFGAAGMAGRIVGASGDDQLVELKSAEGFVMYVALSGCPSQASSAPCTLVKPYAIFNASLPLDLVNTFNYSTANIATLMAMPDGRTLLGVKILLDGGVSTDNLRTYLATYMYDVAALIEGPEDSPASNVAFHPQMPEGPAPGVVPAAGAQENGFDKSLGGAVKSAAQVMGALGD